MRSYLKIVVLIVGLVGAYLCPAAAHRLSSGRPIVGEFR